MPVGLELVGLALLDVVPLDVDVHVPVGAGVLVVEAHGVHHLVLDVAEEVRALADVDRLRDGERPVGATDLGVARPAVRELHVDGLGWKGDLRRMHAEAQFFKLKSNISILVLFSDKENWWLNII